MMHGNGVGICVCGIHYPMEIYPVCRFSLSFVSNPVFFSPFSLFFSPSPVGRRVSHYRVAALLVLVHSI